MSITRTYDTLVSANDNANSLTSVTWPDGYYVTYAYDASKRMTDARERSVTANELANHTYDTLSRRAKVCLGGLTTACSGTNDETYGYESDGQLNALTHNMNGTTVNFGYLRNHSYQIQTLSANDSFYLPAPAASASTTYVPNALNEYGSVNGQTWGNDLNGNLSFWYPASGKATYTYDSENRLVTAAINGSATATVSYDYDGLGRRVSKTVSGTTTTYLLDGDEEIAEYSGGTLLRRYIGGPQIDERIAHAEGNATITPPKTYYHVNHQGSVISVTDSVGNSSQRMSYDEYGNGSPATGEQFGYTGRRFDPETGLYYYRARYYSPQLGRFLQVDPVGYRDDLNLYTYVGNDPLDTVDPTGMDLEVVGTDDFKKKVNAEISKLKSTPSGKAAVEALEKSPLFNKIVADDKKQGNATIPDSKADASNGKGTAATIRFDPDKTIGGKDSKGSNTRPPEVGLAHEMGHAGAMNQGTQSFDRGSGKPGTTPPSEEPSMKTENAVRKDMGLPDRPSYYEQ